MVTTGSASKDPVTGTQRRRIGHRRFNLRPDLHPHPGPWPPRPPRGDSAASPSSITLAQAGQAHGGGITAHGPRGGGRFGASSPPEARGGRQSALDPVATSLGPATRHGLAAATPHAPRLALTRCHIDAFGCTRDGASSRVGLDHQSLRQAPLGDCLPGRRCRRMKWQGNQPTDRLHG